MRQGWEEVNVDPGPQASEILRTKITPPRPRLVRVERPALLSRLDTCLAHKLTLISAPAGFGKTALVSEWVSNRRAQQPPLPSAWVSLDEGDNDPIRFWRYVLTACQTFDVPHAESIGETALTLLHTAQHRSLETVLTNFINDLTQLTQPTLLVLEDYHAIYAQPIHEMLAFLLDYMPPALHLILLARRDPPLPLARLRAQNEMVELRGADLRFSPAEIKLFLQQNLPFTLAPQAVTRLVERTEGWVAGLQLVTLALQRRPQPQAAENFLETVSGSQRHILDYLADEVLAAQPEPLQQFLLQTSIVQRLTAPLCGAVTGRDDSERVLEQIEQANLFLMPLDETYTWYRYHPLFAEAMQQIARRRLGESEVEALYERASQWYAQQGYLEEAIEAALAGGAYADAAGLIERVTGSERANRELHTTRRWLEQLPESLLHSRPKLCLSYAIALLFTSDRSAPETMARVQEPLQIAEQHWLSDEDEPQLGQLFAFRSMLAFWQAEYERSFAAARQALTLLPGQDVYWRSISLFNIEIENVLEGRVQEAHSALLEVRALFAKAGNDYGVRAATHVLGEVCVEQGDLYQAKQLFREVLEAAGEDRLDQSQALLSLAMLAYEWNDLGEAQRYASETYQISLHHAAELGEHLAQATLTVPAVLLLAQVEQARGEISRARQRLRSLQAPPMLSPLARLDIATCRIRLALAAGDLHDPLLRQLASAPAGAGQGERFVMQRERHAGTRARVLIAMGEPVEALRVLEPWRAGAHAHARTNSELEILALMALAHAAQDDRAQAQGALIQALTLAQPGDYQRRFLDEGAPMAALLRELYVDVREGALGGYVRGLLLAFAGEPSAPLAAQPSTIAAGKPLLIEPLSPQEEQVLRLLAVGLSNPEIAREQVVSVNTIKTQVQSIYRKLDVHSREEATDVARSLDLL